MDAADIRAKYWKIRHKMEALDPTIDRTLQLSMMEMLVECAAQLAELNDTLNRSVGLMNWEDLALRLDSLFRKVEQEHGPKEPNATKSPTPIRARNPERPEAG